MAHITTFLSQKLGTKNGIIRHGCNLIRSVVIISRRNLRNLYSDRAAKTTSSLKSDSRNSLKYFCPTTDLWRIHPQKLKIRLLLSDFAMLYTYKALHNTDTLHEALNKRIIPCPLQVVWLSVGNKHVNLWLDYKTYCEYQAYCRLGSQGQLFQFQADAAAPRV